MLNLKWWNGRKLLCFLISCVLGGCSKGQCFSSGVVWTWRWKHRRFKRKFPPFSVPKWIQSSSGRWWDTWLKCRHILWLSSATPPLQRVSSSSCQHGSETVGPEETSQSSLPVWSHMMAEWSVPSMFCFSHKLKYVTIFQRIYNKHFTDHRCTFCRLIFGESLVLVTMFTCDRIHQFAF